MREVSLRLMATGGNVTGLTNGFVEAKLIERHDDPTDRTASPQPQPDNRTSVEEVHPAHSFVA